MVFDQIQTRFWRESRKSARGNLRAKCYWHLVHISKNPWLYFDPNCQSVIDILPIHWKKLGYILTQIDKMLLTSCQYIGKKVDYIFDPNRQNIIDSLSICWRKLEYILTQIGKIFLTFSQYIGDSLNIFWLQLVKYYWHLFNMLEKTWLYLDPNWQNIIYSLSICWWKLEYILTQIGIILLTSCQYVGKILEYILIRIGNSRASSSLIYS